MFRRIQFIVKEKKTGVLILNVMIKNLCNLSNKKLSTLLSLFIGVVWGGEWGDRDLNKWNRGNY